MPATCFGHNCGHPQGGLYAFVGSITIWIQYQYLKWLCVFHFLNLPYFETVAINLALNQSHPTRAVCFI